MIGIIIVTHSNLAAEFIIAAEMIVGPINNAHAVSIDCAIAIEAAQQNLRQALTTAGQDGDGVIILTDMFGGTPTNISAEFLVDPLVEIVTGINLPMLLKCVSARAANSVENLAELLKDYGRNAVLRPAEMLK